MTPWISDFSFKSPDFDALNFVVLRVTLRQNVWKELKMTAFIILREAFSKNNNIWVIKSLKLMSFKYKKQFNENFVV